jgi:hypothetical protein
VRFQFWLGAASYQCQFWLGSVQLLFSFLLCFLVSQSIRIYIQGMQVCYKYSPVF